MANKLIFIRHARTKVDKTVPVERWVLTEDGAEASRKLAESGIFDYVDVLISSNEEKAFLTIKPLADRLGKPIRRVEALGEIKRPNSEQLSLQEYEEMKTRMFKDLDWTDRGWETANHALGRFKAAVDAINKEYESKTLLISAHGTVLTLYFASLQGRMGELFQRWEGLGFGSYGIVEDGKVTKDIV
jgi:broad specificity phosphatase PhoE